MTLRVRHDRVVKLLKAAYSEAEDEPTWMPRLVNELGAMGGARPGGAFLRLATSYDEGGRLRVDRVSAPLRAGDDARWTPATLAAIQEAHAGLEFNERQFGRTRGAAISQLTGFEGGMEGVPGWRECWAEPIIDSLGIVTRDTNGEVTVACVGLTEPMVLDRREQTFLGRIASHVAAAERLRRTKKRRPLEEGEAILSSKGKVLHAEGEAQKQLEVLTDARDRRAYALGSTHDAERALDVWQGLVAGRWSLVDHFDSDGKRYLVAMKKAPPTSPRGALADRERRVLSLVAMGHADKEIAYLLGLSASTISGTLHRIRRKTGLRTRVELAAWWRSDPEER